MDVYTPQIIVNGGPHFTGTDKAAVTSALKETANDGPAMSITTAQDMFNLQIGAGAAPGEDAMVWLLPLVDAIEVEISKGQTPGKKSPTTMWCAMWCRPGDGQEPPAPRSRCRSNL